jgi:hypothetical protein
MKKLTIFIFILFIFSISIANVFITDINYSENENRYLQLFPKFTPDKLLDGSFTADFEEYIQDQMVFRSLFIKTKADYNNNVLQKIENNNIYYGTNILINQFILNDKKAMNENIDFINQMSFITDIMLVPNASAFENDKINEMVYNTNQSELINEIYNKIDKNTIDVYSNLANEDNIYFNTDHHWNSKGSYLGYQAYCEDKDINFFKYTFSEVSDNFKGTLYSKSGMFNIEGDELNTVNELYNFDLKIIIEDKEYSSLFFDEHLEKKDKYSYYLDGNHSYVEISNNELSDDSSILIIKDSYAHIFVPYLVKNYQKIYLVDLRFYQKAVSELVSEKNIENVLFLYNVESFVNDRNLKLLR